MQLKLINILDGYTVIMLKTSSLILARTKSQKNLNISKSIYCCNTKSHSGIVLVELDILIYKVLC